MYPGNKRKKLWKEEKERLLKMTLEDRRKEYLREHVPLRDIPTWMEEMKSKNQSDDENTKEALQVKKSLSEKVSLYRGDITLLEIDAIVNAANSSLLGGGGDVIHTVGPIARGHISDTHKEDLASCYKSSLKLAKENNIRSIAFPCISTGIYGFPNEPAAVIALTTIKEWLNKNHNEMDRVIFCVFLEVDYKIFKKKMSEYFPTDDNEEETEINEDTEELEQKAQSPSPMKCKAKKSENLKDDNEDDNSREEKQSNEETEGQSREADEAKHTAVPSPPSEEGIELCEDKDSSKDSKATQENDPAHHAMCEEDQDEGPQDVSTTDEMKTQTDSQSSCMETEEPLANKEDAIKVEKPMTPIVDENKEEETGAAQGKGKLSAEAMAVENPCDTENISSNDAEMNSQVESINEHSEMQPED
ncbi:ADP-ribose glycohydrolase MACROD2 isoform X4 [Gopherus flavomarginatus]|uniref:ADP-ribose glycohydrolase MACROD2 isoform X4 n=1 Tax=Gopherus flavomarginatus TaxID=286002 RepID=UPI0021CBB8F9|nr:ADP-ribose glycohydrolase MACROD2 isoform X4 [Gopherus flavomarginatus]